MERSRNSTSTIDARGLVQNLSIGIAVAGVLAATAPAAVAASPQAVAGYPAVFFAPFQPNTALDMIFRLPGFTLDTGASVRGFGGAAGNVLIDGERPTSKDDSLDEVLRRIPAASVIKIELIRGGAPGVDMQGKTVLANIVRRPNGGLKLSIDVSGTRWYDGRTGRDLRVEISRAVGETRVEGSLLLDRGIDDAAGNGVRILRSATGALTQTYAEHNAGDTYLYKATGAVETPLLGGKVRLNASLTSSPYRLLQVDDPLVGSGGILPPPPIPGGKDRGDLFPGAGPQLRARADVTPAAATPGVVDLYDQNKKTAEIGLHYDHGLGAKASVETVLLQQFGRYKQTDDFSEVGDVQHFSLAKSTSETIGRTTVKFDPATSLSLQAGAEGDYNWLKDRTAYSVNGAPVVVPAANVRVTETRGEGFVSATWRPEPTMAIEAGLRVEASRIAATGDVTSRRTFVYPKPRIVVTWTPDAADQIRLRVEREVGQLNFDDFAAGQAALANSAVRAGNPNLTPQKDWVFEGAYERKLWGAADATVTVRHYALTDVIDRAPVYSSSGVFDAPGNIGGGHKDEVAFALSLPTDRLFIPRGLITGAAAWRWSSVTDPTTGLRRPISGLHPADVEIHFTQGVPSLKATWGVDVYDQWRETYYRFNEIDTDKKKVFVSMFVDFKPCPDTSFRIELENATGRGFSHARQIYVWPRSIAGPPWTDIRSLHTGRGIYLRIRKTFG